MPLPGQPELPSAGTLHTDLDTLIERFEEAFEAGRNPSIHEFLPTAETIRAAALIELVHIDLERRLKAGESVHVEGYLARFPQLSRDRPELVALILQEFKLRQKREPQLGVEHYLQRFPQYAEEIRARCGRKDGLDVRLRPPRTHAVNVAADRNLLFGIVALQMDFVTNQALIAAMHAWVVDKSKSLGQILLDQNALSGQHRELLEALVDAHIKRHGSDPRRSLEAIGSLTSVRGELDQIVDPDVQASLALVPGASNEQTDGNQFDQTIPHSNTTLSGQRFSFLRPWREGGLGKVSVARDVELNREVALKEIKPQHADNQQSRTRFLLEAEITGSLEHPGIVPVYGLGHYGDGRPYYAMRFVRGDSLEEAIERFYKDGQGTEPEKRITKGKDRGSSERTVAFRELLGRFIDVCNAIAYAHSRGVLHRDLKPSNVILGKYGETLVLDWGLAKVLGKEDVPDTSLDESLLQVQSGSGSAPTKMGSLIGTPAYMSPEQAAGRLDLLGPASDVYSLGATLYSVLTGRSPFVEKDVSALLKKVEQGEFSRPRQINKEIAPALEAICLKAMARNPEDRYTKPTALADDLERWLADEPIAAYREPLIGRIRRWGRRHRAIVTGSAALVVTAAVALAVSTIWISGEHREAVAARKIAEVNRDVAEKRSAESVERFQLALDAFGQLVNGVQSRLESRPGTEDLRRELLESAQQGLSRLVQNAEARSGTDSTVIWSHIKMGDLNLTMGKVKEAEVQFRAALSAAEDAASGSDAAVALHDLASANGRLGWLNETRNDFIAASNCYQKELAICENSVAVQPESKQGKLDLAMALRHLGGVCQRQRDARQAETFYKRELEIIEKNAAADPENRQTQRELSIALAHLGDVSEDPSTGRKCYEKELAITQKLATDDPSNAAMQRDLMLAYLGLGKASQATRDTAAALRFFQKSVEIGDKLFRDDPKNIQIQRDLVVSYQHVGEASETLKRINTARAAYAASAQLSVQLALILDLNDRWDEAAATYAKLVEVSPESSMFGSGAFRTTICRQLAQWDKLFDRVARLRPDEAALWIGRGQYRALRGQWKEAAADYRKGIYERVPGDESFEYAGLLALLDDREEYQRFCKHLAAGHAESQNGSAEFFLVWACGVGPESGIDAEHLVEWGRRAVEFEHVAWKLNALGLAYYRAGKYDLAIQTLEESNSLGWSWQGRPANSRALSWLVLSMAHQRLADSDGAHNCLNTARELIEQARPIAPDAPASGVSAGDWTMIHALLKEADSLVNAHSATTPKSPN